MAKRTKQPAETAPVAAWLDGYFDLKAHGGSRIGTSTTTSYIESAAGVAAGGRTGLSSVFVAILFLLALFFSPLAGMIPAYATSAALFFVACVMARSLAEVDWDDITEYAPAW
jgi:AGZA family xanthine/uracil permease-like MFS transporter